jgi:hypothetical protein
MRKNWKAEKEMELKLRQIQAQKKHVPFFENSAVK